TPRGHFDQHWEVSKILQRYHYLAPFLIRRFCRFRLRVVQTGIFEYDAGLGQDILPSSSWLSLDSHKVFDTEDTREPWDGQDLVDVGGTISSIFVCKCNRHSFGQPLVQIQFHTVWIRRGFNG